MGESWILSFQYSRNEAAKRAWKRARDAILFEDLDASVYRSLINGDPFVVVIGSDELTDELRERFTTACSDGDLRYIPDSVAAYLVDRRNQSTLPGVFWERRSCA